MDTLFDDEDLLINPHEVKGKTLTKQRSFEVHSRLNFCVLQATTDLQLSVDDGMKDLKKIL